MKIRLLTALALLFFMTQSGCAKPKSEKLPQEEPASSAAPALTETSVPEPEDFSAFAGTWHTESGLREITIYENGGFAMKDGTVKYDGYLSAEEQPGWYGLYLEDSSRLGNDMTLGMDPAHPGTLTLTQGLGAELLLRGPRPDEEASAMPFSVLALDERPEVGRVYNLAQSDNPLIFTVHANERLNDFRILGLEYEGTDSEGKPGFVTWELFFQEEMIPNEEITFLADVYGTMPNTGICYEDENGDLHYWYLSISGFDGSLELTPFWD